MYLILFTFLFKIILLSEAEVFHNSSIPKIGYGLFYIYIQEIESCSVRPDKHVKIDVKRKIIDENTEIFTWSIKAENDFRLIKSYTVGDVLKNGKFIKVASHVTSNPCQNKYFKHELPVGAIKNITQCLFSKGLYHLDLDLNKSFHRVIGDKFMYGVLRTQTKYVTENGEYCVLVIAMSTPAKNNKNN